MKTSVVLASVLAAAGSAVADSPFRMLAVSKGATFDGSYIRGTGGRFVLGKQTNSTCGSTAPSFSTTNGTITLYGDGKENAQLGKLQRYLSAIQATNGNLSLPGHLWCRWRPSLLQELPL